MKKSIIYFIICVSLTLGLFSCETDFENPNAATEEQVFSSREGVFAAAVGLQQLYSVVGIRWIVETPAITTREGGITTTFQNMIELEDGGTVLPNFNSNVQGLWSTMLRVIEIAEDIESNADNIELDAGTRSGLIAHAKLFKALAIGSLAQNYEQVIVATSNDNDATFVSRIQGFETAITLLTEAATQLSGTAASEEFINGVTLGNIDLVNTITAYIARYNLFAGNYEAALAAAGNVDLTSTSVFAYDTQNPNPIWARIVQNNTPNFKPRDNFGLPVEFVFDPADGRLAFYLVPLDETNQNGLPIEDVDGFFNEISESIPVYLPDEMNLIIAEANLRIGSPNLAAATAALNEVLTDTDDPFDVNANVAAYSGDNTVDALLNEVYRNRRAELLFTGMSLEDSRRFGRPQPSGTAMNYDEERNRNFYPYPDLERNSNPNTPDDPSI
ncbi:RagB/SusD family nutrient uptake outer membrane protein [Flagellimonas meridianipacifica]|uniref:SusD-like starch-binding protein associating with outer membrane n=1 Tax=Flagellimonas meridianipacifica TaxID=1080225 RepID=A0A2T0M9S9_9FLAO|nr:RagB/SusD family nutrient uptake outer membrane protein [Allomuricauda pacifica]PRX54233.1 SusD-like starch-binding protein associating with outer membrane [Allomuricauda pacifica]